MGAASVLLEIFTACHNQQNQLRPASGGLYKGFCFDARIATCLQVGPLRVDPMYPSLILIEILVHTSPATIPKKKTIL